VVPASAEDLVGVPLRAVPVSAKLFLKAADDAQLFSKVLKCDAAAAHTIL